MNRVVHRSTSLVACFLTMLCVGACTEGPADPTRETVLSEAPSVKDPTVRGLSPDSAFQETTLDVEVTGSNFADDHTVSFELGGVGATKVRVNGQQFVNARTFVVNVTVDADATAADYDVAVTPPPGRGKKGIGTEAFRVLEKNDNSGGQPTPVQLLDLEVETIDIATPIGLTEDPALNAAIQARFDAYDAADGVEVIGFTPVPADYAGAFGCPDVGRPCNRITLVLTDDDWDWVSTAVEPIAEGCSNTPIPGGCLYDPNLQNRWRAAGYFHPVPTIFSADLSAASPAVVHSDGVAGNGEGTFTLTFYWQGQRTLRRSDGTHIIALYPDLDRTGFADHFAFRHERGVGTDVAFLPALNRDCDPAVKQCYALFQGQAATGTLTTVMSGFSELGGKGKGRNKAATGMAFDIASTLGGSAIDTKHTLMLTDPSGVRSVLAASSISSTGERFSFGFTGGSGCYQVTMLQGYVKDTDRADYASALFAVSDRTLDGPGHVAAITFDGSAASASPGTKCVP
jgi:hypothetical protein